ncbi:hypothetical protein PSPO01_05053 [Paraphaeosphaeria sporulosa]
MKPHSYSTTAGTQPSMNLSQPKGTMSSVHAADEQTVEHQPLRPARREASDQHARVQTGSQFYVRGAIVFCGARAHPMIPDALISLPGRVPWKWGGGREDGRPLACPERTR